MFTGIISDITSVRIAKQTKEGTTLTFDRPSSWIDLELGESVATNGICFTVAAIRDTEYDCFAVPETLAKTSFGQQVPPTVNLERSLRANDRFGGHFVQGHVDGVGTVTDIDTSEGYRLTVQFSAINRDLVIYKGSITINGVSLTVAAVMDDKLQVALIPHTLEHTTIGMLQVDDEVNLEFDVLGKYVLNSMKVRTDNAASSTS
jgi:riboflavin synthase